MSTGAQTAACALELIAVVENPPAALDLRGERLSQARMKRLTPMEWALVKGPIAHLSLSARDIGGVADMVAWLAARPGAGWFYVTGVNFHFGSSLDAAEFRRWVSSRAVDA